MANTHFNEQVLVFSGHSMVACCSESIFFLLLFYCFYYILLSIVKVVSYCYCCFSFKICFWRQLETFHITSTVWKEFRYGVLSCPYFRAFGMNTERYFVSLRIQSECGKIQTRKNFVFGRFSHSVHCCEVWGYWSTERPLFANMWCVARFGTTCTI